MTPESHHFTTIHKEAVSGSKSTKTMREGGKGDEAGGSFWTWEGWQRNHRVPLFQGHFPLPTPPIPRISFGSSLSPLLPVNNLAKLSVLRTSEKLLDLRKDSSSKRDWKRELREGFGCG